jgi:hypothetical protein
MSDRTCPHHNVALVQNPGGGWKCPVPGCSHGLKEIEVTEKIAFSMGVGLQGKSGDTIKGQPQREFGGSNDDSGPRTNYEIRRTETGSTVTRSFDHSGPYQGDKEADERRAVERIRSEYNREHGTNFDGVASAPDQNDPVDVWFTEAGERRIGCQVTRSDGREATGRNLGADGKHSETISGEDSLRVMADAIKAKAVKTGGGKDYILVLDGVIPDADGWLEEFKTKHAATLAISPFVEIWYAARHIGGVVKRLK